MLRYLILLSYCSFNCARDEVLMVLISGLSSVYPSQSLLKNEVTERCGEVFIVSLMSNYASIFTSAERRRLRFYVCLFVCLFAVREITQKVSNGFW